MDNYSKICDEINISYSLAESYSSNGDKRMAEACILQARAKATEFENKLLFSWEKKFIDRFTKKCDKFMEELKQD